MRSMMTRSGASRSSWSAMNSRRSSGIEAAFHVDDAAAAAPLEQRLEQQHQVFGFFFDFHVAVAQHAEHARAGDLVAGEELCRDKA